MKLCAAQIASAKGDVAQNIAKHKIAIQKAAELEADLVVFPELSLTGYEPKLAAQLASSKDDPRLKELQKISDDTQITICVGMPIKTTGLPQIGMIVFTPDDVRRLYCKQHLHADELQYFSPGTTELKLKMGKSRIAFAICYESLLTEHAEQASKGGANVYFASVAKSQSGVEKANAHMPVIAKKFGMNVLMSNAIGPNDNFVSSGSSAVWDRGGRCLAQMGKYDEGILLFDTEKNSAEIEMI